MTLGNLLRIGRLKRHDASADEIDRLLGSARRSLANARTTDIGAETRFDAAYVDTGSVEACIQVAGALLVDVERWLERKR